MNFNDETDALKFLEEKDKQFGINKIIEDENLKKEKENNIEVSKIEESFNKEYMPPSAFESPWKILSLELLPSGGLFYGNNAEILLKSATTKQIRHWSTIDENDPISVREKINYILKELTKFSIKGVKQLNFSNYLEIDKYHLLFKIYELTFPNRENKLFAKLKCKNSSCEHINNIEVTSNNLIGFKYPENLMKWFSMDEKCWVINSEKLKKTIRFWLPTIGVKEAFLSYKEYERSKGIEIDESFYEVGPYLMNGFNKITLNDIYELKMKSIGWSKEEFTFIYKFTKTLKDVSINKVAYNCEKCNSYWEDHIFLGGSFTVKDIFIISAGLDELI